MNAVQPPLFVIYGARPLSCLFHHSDAVSALSGLSHAVCSLWLDCLYQCSLLNGDSINARRIELILITC